jgi:two-component system, OmpR family, alkaline phosphatase synthesis response regulator PhoP
VQHDVEAIADAISVLLIEDDQTFADMYRLRLELDGYRVTEARDGKSALELAGAVNPDLIFLDIKLPLLDGMAVLEALRADAATRHIPVVILSAYGEDDLRQRGLMLGALEYLIKSHVVPDEVSRAIPSWAAGVARAD